MVFMKDVNTYKPISPITDIYASEFAVEVNLLG